MLFGARSLFKHTRETTGVPPFRKHCTNALNSKASCEKPESAASRRARKQICTKRRQSAGTSPRGGSAANCKAVLLTNLLEHFEWTAAGSSHRPAVAVEEPLAEGAQQKAAVAVGWRCWAVGPHQAVAAAAVLACASAAPE